jgi:hypothetical protein
MTTWHLDVRPPPQNGLMPEQRERLEKIVIWLLEIAARCERPETQYRLRQVADQIVELAEE